MVAVQSLGRLHCGLLGWLGLFALCRAHPTDLSVSPSRRSITPPVSTRATNDPYDRLAARASGGFPMLSCPSNQAPSATTRPWQVMLPSTLAPSASSARFFTTMLPLNRPATVTLRAWMSSAALPGERITSPSAVIVPSSSPSTCRELPATTVPGQFGPFRHQGLSLGVRCLRAGRRSFGVVCLHGPGSFLRPDLMFSPSEHVVLLCRFELTLRAT